MGRVFVESFPLYEVGEDHDCDVNEKSNLGKGFLTYHPIIHTHSHGYHVAKRRSISRSSISSIYSSTSNQPRPSFSSYFDSTLTSPSTPYTAVFDDDEIVENDAANDYISLHEHQTEEEEDDEDDEDEDEEDEEEAESEDDEMSFHMEAYNDPAEEEEEDEEEEEEEDTRRALQVDFHQDMVDNDDDDDEHMFYRSSIAEANERVILGQFIVSTTASRQSTSTSHTHLTPPRKSPHKVIYRCKKCYSDICSSSLIISKDFWGNNGEAYFVEDVLNVRVDSKEILKNMRTGQYGVKDILCVQCDSVIGWKYVTSVERSQAYKIGKFVIEKNLLKTYKVSDGVS